MPSLRQELTSKTNGVNALAMALVPTLDAAGVKIDPSLVALILGILNIIVRHFTNKPLSEK